MSTPTPPPLDFVLEDVIVLTADPARPLLRNAAVGISGDRIAYVDAASGVAGLQAVRRVPLAGRVVTPGFVNVHTHAILTMVRGVAEDLGFAPGYTPGIPHGHDVTPDEAYALSRLGALEAMRFGSTLINDTYVHADITVKAMSELGLRVHTSGRIHDADFSLIGDGRWEYHDAIGDATLAEAEALATRWHGKADGRIGVQLAAHAPDTCSDRFLRRIADLAERMKLRVNIHLAQSQKEIDQVRARSGKTPAELLDDTGLLNDRLLAAHCLFLTESDIARVGRAKIHVAHVPKGNATGGYMAPTPKLRAGGVNLALGTDNMHADMVEVMRWAIAVARVQEGCVSTNWQPSHALHMATAGAAEAMGLQHEIGAIRVGMKADLAVFDFRQAHLTPDINPLGNLVHTGQGRDVEHVIVDGKFVIENGQPVLADAAEIRREAQRAAEALWKRAGSY